MLNRFPSFVGTVVAVLLFGSCQNATEPTQKPTTPESVTAPVATQRDFTVSEILAYIPTIVPVWGKVPNGTISTTPGIRPILARRTSIDTYSYGYTDTGKFATYLSGVPQIAEEPMPGVYMIAGGNVAIKYSGFLYPNVYYGADLTYAINTSRFSRYDHTITDGVMTLRYYEGSSYDPYYTYKVKLDAQGNGWFQSGSTSWVFNNYRIVARYSEGSPLVSIPMYTSAGQFLYTTAILWDPKTLKFSVYEENGVVWAKEKSVPSDFSDPAAKIVNNNGVEWIFDLSAL